MRRRKKTIIFIFLATPILLYLLVPPVWRLNGGSVEVTQWHRDEGERQANLGPAHKDWISSKMVSRHIFHAIVVAEDSRFYQHSGIDFVEIFRSLKTNLKKGGYARGASTITQQVVKMAFLSREKSISRKLREVMGAVLLEQLVAKQKILEWYINLAEFGDGVYGVKSASWHYFRTKPELLTIAQAAHLALVLPSPNGWSKGLRRKNLTEFGHERFATIVGRMRIRSYITEEQWLETLARGNFGRPIAAYEFAKREPHEYATRYNEVEFSPVDEETSRQSNQKGLLEEEVMSKEKRELQPSYATQYEDKNSVPP